MPYQLPPELRTSKLNSLPDDLREIAEAALAAKFDIPEITVAKKKPAPEKKKNPIPEPMDWDDRFEYVEIVIQTDEREMVPQPMMWSTSSSAAAEMQVHTRYKLQHYQMMVDQRVPHYEIVRQIEYQLRKFIDELRYRGVRVPSSPEAIQLWHRGLRMPINNIRDIEQFVQRSRVGGYGRY